MIRPGNARSVRSSEWRVDGCALGRSIDESVSHDGANVVAVCPIHFLA